MSQAACALWTGIRQASGWLHPRETVVRARAGSWTAIAGERGGYGAQPRVQGIWGLSLAVLSTGRESIHFLTLGLIPLM